jgi:hypothetical protein
MSKVVKKVVAAVAVVAAVVFSGGTALLATIGKALVTAAVSIGVSRLIAKRANIPADAGGDGGARIQLPPATSNKLPIIYGTAFVGGSITDAMLSTDQKTMWYVIALAEVSDDQGGGGGSYSFDTNKCYYDGKQIQFGTNGAVTGLITNTSTPQTDTRCNGFLYVYLFNNGSSSGINTGGQTAAQILSVANGVPASKAWTAGQQTMTNCAFAIVKVIYNTDAGTTGVGQLMVNMTNSITKPGTAILDYMLNERYGCGLPLDSIDTTSLTALDAYSDQLIYYQPVGGGFAQQVRYRINGPLDTGSNCLNNLQFLVDSCDSWLQYSELTGKWKVVINKKYDNYPDPSGLYAVNSSNLIGGIEVSPIDLNETYNQIEVAYPNTNIKDQTDYYIIDLFDEDPQLLSPNEAINRLNVTLPLVNNAVQARYLAARRIYQSREDLVIAFRLDYSGIQVEAGDIIRVTHEVYGWTDKLFRVNNVSETKDEGGNLYADIQAFEYSDQIYDDIVQDYVPAFNTGLSDPNVISSPGAPTIVNFTDANALITGFNVTSTSPTDGIVLYMDFNYGINSNVQEHRLYRTIQQANSAPYAGNTSVTIPVNDLPKGFYYWSTTARNNLSGKRSPSSDFFNWDGANIQPYNPNTATGGIIGNQIQNNTIVNNNIANYTLQNGKIANNTLTINNFNTNLSVMTSIGYSDCFIMDNVGNNYIAPVNVTTRSNYSGVGTDPFFITGTNPGASYIFPVYQNTATTANGYYTDSTGVWQPGEADNTARENGDWNWYIILDVPLTETIGAGFYFTNKIDAGFVSNVDATIQIAQGVRFSSSNTFIVCTDTGVDTINLKQNQPTKYVREYTGSGTGTMIAATWMIRNITNSSNVTCYTAKAGAFKGYGGPI